MLLRNPFSNTKKFFQKTLGSLKSLFSPGNYEKLPKHVPNYAAVDNMNSHLLTSTTYKDLDKLYTDFTDQWDSKIQNIKRSSSLSSSNNKKKLIVSTPTKLQDHNLHYQRADNCQASIHNTSSPPAKIETFPKGSKEEVGIRGNCLVVEKLKELEMLDMSNVDHVLDIQEVLHYYSRLTSPAYLEIVDKFFMDMYAEFFGPSAKPPTPARSTNSKHRLRSSIGC